ncbi:PAS domain S-box protein [Belnapia rosea]|uniref:histidine kinase n=1 Tax=Belnapia rosea TaxID=938405 RepID=A0A1G6M3P0_9PROT|nr:PAS domain S-box protein [Belnapia rosea]SDC49924.1 PAS domain S-box-containing protein [Belnapia rosea]
MSETPGSTPSELAAEQARIGAELLGLDASTDPFVSAVRATRMPMIITNPRLRDNPVAFANDAFCRLTGYRREEILGRNCRFLQGPESDPATIGRIRAAIEAEESIEIDIRNHRKDGTAFWNRLLLAPVRDAAGRLAYFFASQLDVTPERERMAGLESHNAALLAELSERLHSLEESEARLRFATEAGRLGIWELDLRSGAMTASATCRADFGIGPEVAFTYEVLRAAIYAADRPRLEAAIGDCLASGSEFGLECRVGRPDGRPGWIELRARILRDEDGRPLRMAGTSRDITGRKQAEAQDRAQLELADRFRGLGEPAELAIAAAEVLGRTLGVSRAGYGTIDAATDTVTIARDWTAPGVASVAGRHDLRHYGSFIEELKRGRMVAVADCAADPRTNGRLDALRAVGVMALVNIPVSERAGAIALLIVNHAMPRDWQPEELAFIQDVAERTRLAMARRQAEQDLRALANSLESQVNARTAALMETEAALRQSQKMEAVGQLTGGLAHDFNNLLAGIAGSLELMKTRIAQGRLSEVHRYLTAARGAADRAAALTHRLLAFSRRQTLEPKPTDTNRLIAGLEELVRRTVGPAITVEVVGAAGLWTVMVDQSQLENAVLNLCINARDAMPGGGRLTIETANRWLDDRAAASRDLPTGQYVALSVSDTGTGMSPDVIAKAFDPFFTTKPLGQGTGLGLSMIYGFARQSGGQVRIYSELGQGTLVSIYLPRHFGPSEEAEAVRGSSDPPRAERGETVLIVDDEPTIRMLVADVLLELGYTAIEAEDGAAGLKVLRSTVHIDLLVTDVGLPGGMNGRQLADAGRDLRRGLKVLFITGYAENAAIGHGHLEPGMHVLTKPFAMETLASRIREMIAAR